MASQLSHLLLCLIWRHFNAMFSQFILFFSLCVICVYMCVSAYSTGLLIRRPEIDFIYFSLLTLILFIYLETGLFPAPTAWCFYTFCWVDYPKGSGICFCLLTSSGFMGVCLQWLTLYITLGNPNLWSQAFISFYLLQQSDFTVQICSDTALFD